MEEFASAMSTEDIRQRIEQLMCHKVIQEIALLLRALRKRRGLLQYRIITEMVDFGQGTLEELWFR